MGGRGEPATGDPGARGDGADGCAGGQATRSRAREGECAGAREEVRIVTLQVDVFDRSGLLLEIAGLLEDENVNIAAISTRAIGSGGKVRVIMDLEIANPRQLVRILHRAHALVNVYAISYLRTPIAPTPIGRDASKENVTEQRMDAS